MMLWLVMALMTAAAIFAVLWPLSRRAPLRTGSDVAVYRDQLEEIDRDRAAGLIGEREAEAARVEVSRRLLAAADVAVSAPQESSGRRRRVVALAALLLLPVGAGGALSDARFAGPAGAVRRRRGANCRRSNGPLPIWSRGSRRISKAIPRTAAAGRSSARSICGSAATTTP